MNELVQKIQHLKKKKNAIILAHYYARPEVQDIADFVGDSLALSQKAASNDADIIVFAGVRFMAETAKILSPNKKVLLPIIEAGCSLADSCTAEQLREARAKYPDRKVITYINTNTDVKILSDIVCTSSNAFEVVNSLPENEKILFIPDNNLGTYIKENTNRDIVLWEGGCHVHQGFSAKYILSLKAHYPEAKVLVHPESGAEIRNLGDYIGSTSALINASTTDTASTFIVATEPGVIHQMQLLNPHKTFIPAGQKNISCFECQYMKMNTINDIYDCLLNESPEILIDTELIAQAAKPILKMLELRS